MKDRKELIRKVAYKIWEITGKGDDRTLQNWLDAEDIADMVLSYYRKQNFDVDTAININLEDVKGLLLSFRKSNYITSKLLQRNLLLGLITKKRL